MSAINQVYLNRDLAQLKTNLQDITMKVKGHEERFNFFNDLQVNIQKEHIKTKVALDSKLHESLASINDMLVDLISDVQMIRREMDDLQDNKVEVEIIEKKQIEDGDKREKAKPVLEYIKSIDFDNDYDDIIMNLGCKTKDDIKMFSEKELIESGFLKLHARKILK